MWYLYSCSSQSVYLFNKSHCVFFSQRPVVHSSPRPVHLRRFLAKTAQDLSINGLTGGHIINRPNQPRPTALYMTANAGIPRCTCQYTGGQQTSKILHHTTLHIQADLNTAPNLLFDTISNYVFVIVRFSLRCCHDRNADHLVRIKEINYTDLPFSSGQVCVCVSLKSRGLTGNSLIG